MQLPWQLLCCQSCSLQPFWYASIVNGASLVASERTISRMWGKHTCSPVLLSAGRPGPGPLSLLWYLVNQSVASVYLVSSQVFLFLTSTSCYCLVKCFPAWPGTTYNQINWVTYYKCWFKCSTSDVWGDGARSLLSQVPRCFLYLSNVDNHCVSSPFSLLLTIALSLSLFSLRC